MSCPVSLGRRCQWPNFMSRIPPSTPHTIFFFFVFFFSFFSAFHTQSRMYVLPTTCGTVWSPEHGLTVALGPGPEYRRQTPRSPGYVMRSPTRTHGTRVLAHWTFLPWLGRASFQGTPSVRRAPFCPLAVILHALPKSRLARPPAWVVKVKQSPAASLIIPPRAEHSCGSRPASVSAIPGWLAGLLACLLLRLCHPGFVYAHAVRLTFPGPS
ncbi:hypothetical protein LY76DRAFT_192348 [Colletotrichum caudatum]|nr:hypothetical protein LY76DRAFT_192348 [Colletotrichum caudatum]